MILTAFKNLSSKTSVAQKQRSRQASKFTGGILPKNLRGQESLSNIYANYANLKTVGCKQWKVKITFTSPTGDSAGREVAIYNWLLTINCELQPEICFTADSRRSAFSPWKVWRLKTDNWKVLPLATCLSFSTWKNQQFENCRLVTGLQAVIAHFSSLPISSQLFLHYPQSKLPPIPHPPDAENTQGYFVAVL